MQSSGQNYGGMRGLLGGAMPVNNPAYQAMQRPTPAGTGGGFMAPGQPMPSDGGFNKGGGQTQPYQPQTGGGFQPPMPQTGGTFQPPMPQTGGGYPLPPQPQVGQPPMPQWGQHPQMNQPQGYGGPGDGRDNMWGIQNNAAGPQTLQANDPNNPYRYIPPPPPPPPVMPQPVAQAPQQAQPVQQAAPQPVAQQQPAVQQPPQAPQQPQAPAQPRPVDPAIMQKYNQAVNQYRTMRGEVTDANYAAIARNLGITPEQLMQMRGSAGGGGGGGNNRTAGARGSDVSANTYSRDNSYDRAMNSRY